MLCVFAPLFFACLGVTVPRASADSTTEARQAIQFAHSKIDIALERKNFPDVTAACTPDFVSINDEGRHFSAAQVRSGLSAQLARAQSVQSTTIVQSVSLTPTGAAVTLVQHLVVLTRYKVLFFGRLAHTTLDQTRREEWIKANGTWRLKQSHTLINNSHTSL
jgi:hypothetical protein